MMNHLTMDLWFCQAKSSSSCCDLLTKTMRLTFQIFFFPDILLSSQLHLQEDLSDTEQYIWWIVCNSCIYQCLLFFIYAADICFKTRCIDNLWCSHSSGTCNFLYVVNFKLYAVLRNLTSILLCAVDPSFEWKAAFCNQRMRRHSCSHRPVFFGLCEEWDRRSFWEKHLGQ